MANPKNSNAQQGLEALREAAMDETASVLERLRSSPSGLSEAEAAERLEVFGPNEVAQEKQHGWLRRLWVAVRNPLVILLTVLAIVSFATYYHDDPDHRDISELYAGVVMMAMVVLGLSLAFHPGNQGRQRRRQTQGDDQGHRHGVARRPAEGNSAATTSCPATW